MKTAPLPAESNPWEDAYRRFETPEQEIQKFIARLRRAGAGSWPKDSRIVELFCGRGNGLHALQRLGFQQLDGIDLSPTLAAQYQGPARVTVADCRQLPFPDGSRDILIVQGGLHHLPTLPADLRTTLGEARRVLRDGGLFLAVEPWLTPFLRFVHALCDSRLVRRVSPKLDALAIMIHHERETYFQWLREPELVIELLREHFEYEQCCRRFGKLHFLGHTCRVRRG